MAHDQIQGIIGPLTVHITSYVKDGISIFEEELTDKSNTLTATPHLKVLLNRHSDLLNFQPVISVAKGKVQFNEAGFYNSDIPSYSGLHLFNLSLPSELTIDAHLPSFYQLADFLRSFYRFRKHPLSPRVMSYSLFWYIVHLTLLKFDCSFIHAAVVVKNDESTLIVGTGGAGKTSLLFRILEDKSVRYQAEDFGILHQSGVTHLSPKALSVYGSDIKQNTSVLIDYYNRLSLQQRLRWRVAENIIHKNPLVKVSVFEVLKNRIQQQAALKRVLFFMRSHKTDWKHYSASAEEMSLRAVHSSLREVKVLHEMLYLINANKPKEYTCPSIHDITQKMQAVYLKAFADAQCTVIELPASSTAHESFTYLAKHALI